MTLVTTTPCDPMLQGHHVADTRFSACEDREHSNLKPKAKSNTCFIRKHLPGQKFGVREPKKSACGSFKRQSLMITELELQPELQVDRSTHSHFLFRVWFFTVACVSKSSAQGKASDFPVPKYPFLVGRSNGDPALALFESSEFKSRPLHQRVVSSTFKPKGFGDYRLHANVTELCKWVLRAPVPQRNFNTVILDDQPVRLFLDLDMATTEGMSGSELINTMLEDVRDVLRDAFALAYPNHVAAAASRSAAAAAAAAQAHDHQPERQGADGLCSNQWWYFAAPSSVKASFHIHADPDSLHHPVWRSAVELGVFMKQYVQPLLEQEWRDGKARAHRLELTKVAPPAAGAVGSQDLRKLKWFIDFSVYSRTRSLKLPLCCKPGKSTMKLLRAPDGVIDVSDLKQVLVGVPQVWPESIEAAEALKSHILPDLRKPSFASASKSTPPGGEFKLNNAVAGVQLKDPMQHHRAAVVLAFLQNTGASLGSAAKWSSFEANIAARTAKGTFAKQSVRCPWKQGVHNSNQLKVSIEKGQMNMSCWAPTCQGERITMAVDARTLGALFDKNMHDIVEEGSSHANNEESNASSSGCSSEAPSTSCPVATMASNAREFKHMSNAGSHCDMDMYGCDAELDQDLSIEQEIMDEQQQELHYDQEQELYGNESAHMHMHMHSGGASLKSNTISSNCSTSSSSGRSNAITIRFGDVDANRCCDDNGSIPGPLEDNTELAKCLSIEQSILSEQEQARMLVNFGMPLRETPGVRSIDRRYLLPPSLDVPGAEQQMRELMMHRRLGIQSPMDTAKSSAFIMYIKWALQQFPTLRVLLVTCRVTLTGSLKQRLTEAGVQCSSYLDCDTTTELQQAQVAIVQLDSICRLEGARPYELVLLDESESTLFHFHAATLKRRSDVWQTMHTTVQRATQLVLLDASLGGRSQQLLEQMIPTGGSNPAFAQSLLQNSADGTGQADEVRIWTNKRRTDDKTYRVHTAPASFHAELHRLLQQGKKIAVVSNVCKKAKALHFEIATQYPRLRVLLLTSESDQADKLADCNTAWLQYDVVIYSPTIGAGVDFNPPSGPHFDAVLAWSGATSNPAREFMQMVGRVRKVGDRTVHIYLPASKKPTHGLICSRESILEEMEHRWESLNSDSLLDPAMRQQLVGSDGAVFAKYHEPVYRELYVHNRLEEARSRQGMFAALVRQAIQDNLSVDDGGRMLDSNVELNEETSKAVDKVRLDAAELQMQQECARIAQDTFASAVEQMDSKRRMDAQQGTERDKRLAKRQYIVHTYNLQAVPMVVEPTPAIDRDHDHHDMLDNENTHVRPDVDSVLAAAATGHVGAPSIPDVATFAELIRDHGDATDQFKMFCRANGPLAALKQLWSSKITGCPEEQPLQLPEWRNFEDCRLLKGLLRAVGFTSCPTGAAAAADASSSSAAAPAPTLQQRCWEDGGDLCCLDSVNTDIVEQSASEPDARSWLDTNAKWIQLRFNCKLTASPAYTAADLTRSLRSALKRVGLVLRTCDKKTKASSDGGPARTVTSWTLVSLQRDSLLELAYSDSLRFQPDYMQIVGNDVQAAAAWDVASTLDAHQPKFRWQSLTGVCRPAHWMPCISNVVSQQHQSQLGSVSGSGEKKKRKRKKPTVSDMYSDH